MILSYNRELCNETRRRIVALGMEDWVICMTFHGLATYCVGPTYDDIALADTLDALDAGTVRPARYLDNIGCLLIDEGQDFRPGFLRLLSHVVQTNQRTQYMVVGDPRQMLYDYSEDDPANLQYLGQPAAYFVSSREWTTVTLDVTHRMTPAMAALVGCLFDVDMRSAKGECAQPVEVRTLSVWKTAPAILEIVRREGCSNCCILVPTKKNNGPLRAVVNYLSRHGVKLFIHGIDGQDERIKRNKLTVSTWHAAKGTQQKVCLVLGLAVDYSSTNAAYVALTRGMERLVVFLDDRCPDARVLHAIERLPNTVVQLDDATSLMLTKLDALPQRHTDVLEADLICVDAWRPSGSGRWMTELTTVTGCPEDAPAADTDDIGTTCVVSTGTDLHENVAALYRIACLMFAEKRCSGRVRRLADMRYPLRGDSASIAAAIKNGSSAHLVNSSAPENALLDIVYADRLSALYRARMPSCSDWCFLACASRAWYGFHHTLRQLEPFDWMSADQVSAGAAYLARTVGARAGCQWDVRLVRTHMQKTVHMRCDASSTDSGFLCVWDAAITRAHHLEAALVCALHSSGTCTILNVPTQQAVVVTVNDQDAVLTRLVESAQERQVPPA